MIASIEGQPKLSWSFDLILFISSYFPLFLILYLRDIERVELSPPLIWWGYEVPVITASPLAMILLSVSLFCCVILGVFCTNYLGKKHSSKIKSEFKTILITDAKQIHGDMINFTLPFLIGLFAFDYNSVSSVASLFIFLTFMFLFLRAENMLMLNPMFLLRQVSLHEISYIVTGDEQSKTSRVLSIGTPLPSTKELYLKEVLGTNFLCKKGSN